MSVRFRLLGPLEVLVDGQAVPMRSGRQRSLLAALLVDAGRVVGVRDLVWRIWGVATPAGARETLHSYVMRLRRTLGTAGSIVRTHPDGYLIDVPDDALDLTRFTAGVRAAAAAGGDPARVAALLAAALAEWRGDALSDVPSEPLHDDVVPALHEQRLTATEARVDADLALGRHQDVIAELADLTTRHPLRERFWAQRMLALYRADRPAEALRCYERARALITTELGAEPGPELRALHQSILTDDPALNPPGERRSAPEPLAHNDLPGDIPDFAGRESELDRLLATIPAAGTTTAVVISAIDGMAGIGKTTLAVHAAHRLAARYPDAQLFIDLRGHHDGLPAVEPVDALDTLLRALGVPGERIPASLDERARLWRAELTGRRALVVLDNAAGAAQVRPLLPGGAGCLVLVTSRGRLPDLDTAATISLDVLAPKAAAALFAAVVGDARTGESATESTTVTDVLRRCGFLPLAIRIAGARLRSRPAWTVAHLAAKLADEQARLAELAVGQRSVAAAFTLSYSQLEPTRQRLFRRLGLVPGTSFDAYVAAALAECAPADAERVLEDLVDVHLLRQSEFGRYHFHDLLGAYARTAADRIDDAADRNAAIGRLLDYYLATAHRAAVALDPNGHHAAITLGRPPTHGPDVTGYPAALSWLDGERANLAAAAGLAHERGRHRHAWQLPYTLWRYYRLRGDIDQWIRTHQIALVAARKDGAGEADVHRAIGHAYWAAGEFHTALDHQNSALRRYREIGDRWGEGSALNNIGNSYLHLSRYDEALACYRASIECRRAVGDRQGEGNALGNIGVIHTHLGRFDEALRHHNQAIELYRAIGDRRDEANALNNVGDVLTRIGTADEALRYQRQALALYRQAGDRWGEAVACNGIASAHRELGEYDSALERHAEALARIREIGQRQTECEILTALGRTQLAAGRPADAHDTYARALDLATDINDRYLAGNAHRGMALASEDTRPDTAAAHWRAALAIYTEINVPEADAVRARLAGGTVPTCRT